MKKHFWKSIKTVASNIGFVLLLSIIGIYRSDSSLLLMLIPAILSFIAETVIYGRLAEIIQDKAKEPYIRLYERHWVNYFKVIIVMLIPVGLLSIFLTMLNPTGEKIYLLIAGTVIGPLTIYVYPYVFLKQEGALSIKYGISFLVRNFAGTIPLIACMLVIFIINLVVHKQFAQIYVFLFDTLNIYAVVSMGFIKNVITVFIGLVVFVTACRILLEHGALER